MKRCLSVGVVLLLACLGCRSEQLANDQDHIRAAVLDLHTNQIMDNLIRIRRGLPIIQLDYVHMTGTITQTGMGGVSGSDTNVGVTGATPAALARTFTNIFGYSAGATQVTQLTVNAEPVLNDPEVYNAYLAFLSDQAHLQETCEPPPCGSALIVRCANRDCCDPLCCAKKHQKKVYFWVPCSAKDEFFKLALHVVALRGEPVGVSPKFAVTITDLPGEPKTKDKDIYTIQIKLNKSLPNDDGYLIATVNGKPYQSNQDFTVLHNDKVKPADPDDLKDDQKTDTFRLRFSLKALKIDKIDDVVKDLRNQKVNIRLNNFVPGGSKTDRLLEDVRVQLELSRLGQFQPPPR